MTDDTIFYARRISIFGCEILHVLTKIGETETELTCVGEPEDGNFLEVSFNKKTRVETKIKEAYMDLPKVKDRMTLISREEYLTLRLANVNEEIKDTYFDIEALQYIRSKVNYAPLLEELEKEKLSLELELAQNSCLSNPSICKDERPAKRQHIQGVDYHSYRDEIREYTSDAPLGEWIGRLDYHAWGRKTNLFLYFTTHEGEKCRLCVYRSKKYAPYYSDLLLDTVPIGSLLMITTSKTKNDNVAFDYAEYYE